MYICHTGPHSCTIQRHQALETRWPGLLLQAAFFRCCQTKRAHFMAVWPLIGISKTAWGTKLILTEDLASPASCASLGHLLMAQLCHLCLNVCFSPPMAPQPTLPPSHLPTPYRLNL